MDMNEKITIICTVCALVISIVAFTYGTEKILKKGKPLYFQIIIWAVLCYCLQCIESFVVYLCGDFSDRGIVGQIAMCGFFFALISANFGALDSIVDDRSQNNGKYRKIALVAPVAFGIASIFAFRNIFHLYDIAVSVYGIALISMIIASYFNLKHLLLPNDELGFLSCTKWCNIICLIIYALSVALIIIYERVNPIASNVLNVVLSILVLALTFAAEKGEKSWPI